MAKYIKLGKKAKGGSFFEPTNQVSIYGDKVQKVTALAFAHPIVVRAINAGHLSVADEVEFKKYLESNPIAKKKEASEQAAIESSIKDNESDDVDYRSMNKSDLIEYALTVESMEFDEDELKELTKKEIYSELEGED